MLSVVMLSVIMLSVIMLIVVMLCRYAECRYANRRSASRIKYCRKMFYCTDRSIVLLAYFRSFLQIFEGINNFFVTDTES